MRTVLPDGSISAEPVEVLTTRYRYWLPKDGSGQYKRAPRIAYYRAADATWYGHASYLVAEHEDGTQEWADVLEPIAYANFTHDSLVILNRRFMRHEKLQTR